MRECTSVVYRTCAGTERLFRVGTNSDALRDGARRRVVKPKELGTTWKSSRFENSSRQTSEFFFFSIGRLVQSRETENRNETRYYRKLIKEMRKYVRDKVVSNINDWIIVGSIRYGSLLASKNLHVISVFPTVTCCTLCRFPSTYLQTVSFSLPCYGITREEF